MVYNQFIGMAHLKLFFPGLSNSNGLCHFLFGHSGLGSLSTCSQDQGCDLQQQRTANKSEGFHPRRLRWRRYHHKISPPMRILREKVESLTCVQDTESNDFGWEENDDHFVHALQLEQEYRFDDVETVRSERWSAPSRKLSFSSETDSLEESIILPIQ